MRYNEYGESDAVPGPRAQVTCETCVLWRVDCGAGCICCQGAE